MTPLIRQRAKLAWGLVLGVGIGAACRHLGIASPAPPSFAGALLVVAMTVGYILADKWATLPAARQRPLCGGPDGSTKSGDRPPIP